MSDAPTRGERNNNPGNLNYVEVHPWQGQIGLEIVPDGESFTPRFGRYDTIENGIRAIAKQLLAYQRIHKCLTIRQLVSRWAPGKENDTAAYIKDVCGAMGVAQDELIDLNKSATLAAFVRAIIKHENGRCIYDAMTVADASRDALA